MTYFSPFRYVVVLLFITSLQLSLAIAQEVQSSPSDVAIGALDLLTDQEERSALVIVPGNLYTQDAVRLSAKEPGIVESVVMLGDEVNAGQTIVKLDQNLPQARLRAAEKELEIARIESENDVDLQYARVSSRVNQQVLERSLAANRQYEKALSKTEIEGLRLELKRSQLSAEQAEKTRMSNRLNEQLRCDQLEIAEIQLANRTISAPIAGVITEINVARGEWVNSGQVIARIVGTDKLRFAGLVDSREILPNAISDRAALVVDYGSNFSAGEAGDSRSRVAVRITFINPEIDPASGLYEIRAEVDNREGKMYSGLKGILKLRRKNR